MSMQETVDQPEVTPEVAPEVQAEAPAEETTAEQVETQTEQPEETKSEEEQPRDDKGRFKGVQGRMDELTRARREAEREAAYWRAVAEGKGQQAPAEKPSQDRFATYDEYVEALTEWKADQKIAQALGQRAEQVVRTTQAQTFEERLSQTRAALPDFDAVVGKAQVEIADHVRESIIDSEHGPQIAYHLAKNPDEAVRLSQMSPLAAAREIGRLESALARPAPKPQVSVSQAPPPTRPVSSGRSAALDLSKVSMDEYVAMRRKQGASWAR